MAVIQSAKDVTVVTTGTVVEFDEAMTSTDYTLLAVAYKTGEEGEEEIVPCFCDPDLFTKTDFTAVPVEDCQLRYQAVVHGAYSF
jgi:hypothetical protein